MDQNNVKTVMKILEDSTVHYGACTSSTTYHKPANSAT